MLSFPPFRLDLEAERLWKNDTEVRLRRKPFAILRYLVDNPKRLVTHAELVEAVWGKIAMSESLLRTHVHDLRGALGEGVIETVVGRGYRFIAEIRHAYADEPALPEEHGGAAEAAAKRVVGRDAELDVLRAALRSARDRKRATVFVTGEAGVGKTTLVDTFLEPAVADGSLLVGRGTCVEQFGTWQAYLPVLDAIGSLCRARGASRAVDLFAEHAPTWLAQMPGLLRPDRLAEVQRRASGATQARSLRELAEALDALSAATPVALVLEDLQWTDPSTAEFLAFLGSRREPARLVVVGTYRVADVPRAHPLTRVTGELLAHRQASSIALDGLAADAVETYLAKRFPRHRFPSELAETLHRSTGGNPLFIATMVDDLDGQGLLREREGQWELSTSVEDVAARRPDSVRRLIDTQIDRLGAADQRILEVAAIAGMTFTAGVVAHALDADVDTVDSACESLASERRLLEYVGTETWPDGTIQSRYSFGHSLFQHAALTRSTSATVRVRHRKIGERLEAGYAQGAEEVADELAVHFDRGQVPAKAARYYLDAGDRAGRRYGLREAILHFERARALVEGMPRDRDRDLLEARALRSLGWKVFQVEGSADAALPLVEKARDLATSLGDKPGLAEALAHLHAFYVVRSELPKAGDCAASIVPLLDHLADPAIRARVRELELATYVLRGDFQQAFRLLADFGVLRADEGNGPPEARGRHFAATAFGAFALWSTGKPDDAVALARRGYESAEALDDPWERAALLSDWATVHALRREPAQAADLARRSLALAEKGAFGMWNDRADLLSRWAEVKLAPTVSEDRARELLTKRSERVVFGRTLSAVLRADMCLHLGRADQALAEIAEALESLARTDERWLEPELHRVRGEIVRSKDAHDAEQSFLKAIEVARAQSSTSLELRATLSLHSLVSGAKKKRAREDVARALAQISGGADAPDVAEARKVAGEPR